MRAARSRWLTSSTRVRTMPRTRCPSIAISDKPRVVRVPRLPGKPLSDLHEADYPAHSRARSARAGGRSRLWPRRLSRRVVRGFGGEVARRRDLPRSLTACRGGSPTRRDGSTSMATSLSLTRGYREPLLDPCARHRPRHLHAVSPCGPWWSLSPLVKLSATLGGSPCTLAQPHPLRAARPSADRARWRQSRYHGTGPQALRLYVTAGRAAALRLPAPSAWRWRGLEQLRALQNVMRIRVAKGMRPFPPLTPRGPERVQRHRPERLTTGARTDVPIPFRVGAWLSPSRARLAPSAPAGKDTASMSP